MELCSTAPFADPFLVPAVRRLSRQARDASEQDLYLFRKRG